MSIQAQRGTVNSRSDGAKSAATALAAFSDREGYSIQNVDTGALFVKFGTGCTTTSYDLVLKGGSGAADGSGGAIFVSGPLVWTGIITVASAGTASYVAVDF